MTTTRIPLADRSQIHLWIKGFLAATRGQVTLMLILFVLSLAAGLAGPRLLGYLVESVEKGTTTIRVDLIALAFAAVLLLQTIFRKSAETRAVLIGERALADAREGFVGKLLRIPVSRVESLNSGDLISRATSDVEKLDESVRFAMPRILMATLTVILTIGAMLITSPLLTLVMLISLPPLLISGTWYRRRAARAYERLLADWADVQAQMYETVHGAETVESLRLGKRRIATASKILAKAEQTQRRTIDLQTKFLPCLDLAVSVPLVAMLLLGGLAYTHAMVDLAALTAMVLYAERLAEPLTELVEWVDKLQMGNAALRRILGVQQIPSEQSGGSVSPKSGHLSLQDVHFGYRPESRVLQGVDLTISEGEVLVVLGSSGSGKSTLAKLLAGISTPNSGTVLLGGVPISEIPAERFRREVAMVTQEQHIFAGTVRDNLTLVEQTEPGGHSDDRLWRALRAVEADHWVRSLPDGLDTEVGPGCADVPSALMQQLALARILLTHARVLILDEATADLDLFASARIERSFAALLRGCTVVVIAHRMDIAPLADRVLLFEDGHISELGSHDELLARNGRYAELWETWSKATARNSITSPDEPIQITGTAD